MAPGGAQQYYGVNADAVVYGKTLGAAGERRGLRSLDSWRFDETRLCASRALALFLLLHSP